MRLFETMPVIYIVCYVVWCGFHLSPFFGTINHSSKSTRGWNCLPMILRVRQSWPRKYSRNISYIVLVGFVELFRILSSLSTVITVKLIEVTHFCLLCKSRIHAHATYSLLINIFIAKYQRRRILSSKGFHCL